MTNYLLFIFLLLYVMFVLYKKLILFRHTVVPGYNGHQFLSFDRWPVLTGDFVFEFHIEV